MSGDAEMTVFVWCPSIGELYRGNVELNLRIARLDQELKAVAERYERDLERVASERDAARRDWDRLRKEKDTAVVERDVARAGCKRLQEEGGRLRCEMSAIVGQREDFERQRDRALGEIQALEEIAEHKSCPLYTELRAEVDSLGKKNDWLNGQVDQRDRYLSVEGNRLIAKSRELDDANHALEHERAACQALADQVEAREGELNSLRHAYNELEYQLHLPLEAPIAVKPNCVEIRKNGLTSVHSRPDRVILSF